MEKANTGCVSKKGFLLQELMVGLVIFGIVMYPILRALVLLPRITATAAAQSRAEMWRSANDSFIGQGIDANHRASLESVASGLHESDLRTDSVRLALLAQPGAPQINFLSEEGEGIAEARATPLGVEIAASTLPVEARTDPLAPLPVIRVLPPSLSPASGTFLNVMTLSTANGIYAAKLQSSAASPIDRVFLKENGPDAEQTASIGEASLMMSANALARGFRGASWSEFSGNQETDTKVSLDDGRARWVVKVGEQVQVYEPSDFVEFIYGVDIGRPVYDFAGTEFSSGSQVSVNFAQAQSISRGTDLALVTYPQAVRERFGASWSNVVQKLDWFFGNHAGDSSSGNTKSIFSDVGRNLWSDSQTLTAEPVSQLAGVRAWSGTWQILRTAMVLSPPERVSGYYDASTDEVGIIDFSAPAIPSLGLRIGRPKVDGIESIGSTLSVPLVP